MTNNRLIVRIGEIRRNRFYIYAPLPGQTWRSTLVSLWIHKSFLIIFYFTLELLFKWCWKHIELWFWDLWGQWPPTCRMKWNHSFPCLNVLCYQLLVMSGGKIEIVSPAAHMLKLTLRKWSWNVKHLVEFQLNRAVFKILWCVAFKKEAGE